MKIDDYERLELWELQKLSTPRRSRLFRLNPVGIGTPLTESITSYVARLAGEHCLTTKSLFMTEIARQLKGEEFLSNLKSGGMSRVLGAHHTLTALNGSGLMAANLVKALEALTIRSDLRFLTMLSWTEVTSKIGLLRRHRAWCPTCYEEWRMNGKVVYEPLLWAIEVVNICPQHYQRLMDRCPHCQQQLFVIAELSRPGYCSKCGEWLGSLTETYVKNNYFLPDNELYWQIYVVECIGDLIAAAPRLSSPVTRERIATAIDASIWKITNGNIYAFNRFSSISPTLLRSWIRGKAIPTLGKLLRITYSLEIPLLEFLLKDIDELTGNIQFTPQKIKNKSHQRIYKRVNKEQLRKALEEIIEQEPPLSLTEVTKYVGYTAQTLRSHFPQLCLQIKERYALHKKDYHLKEIEAALKAALKQEPPPSVSSISKVVGYKNPGYLYQLLPELCKEIARRYKEYKKAGGVKKIENLCQEVQKVAHELHREGKKPTEPRVAARLTHPIAMCNRKARSSLSEIRRELGYEE